MNIERLEWLREQVAVAVKEGNVELEFECLEEMDTILRENLLKNKKEI